MAPKLDLHKTQRNRNTNNCDIHCPPTCTSLKRINTTNTLTPYKVSLESLYHLQSTDKFNHRPFSPTHQLLFRAASRKPRWTSQPFDELTHIHHIDVHPTKIKHSRKSPHHLHPYLPNPEVKIATQTQQTDTKEPEKKTRLSKICQHHKEFFWKDHLINYPDTISEHTDLASLTLSENFQTIAEKYRKKRHCTTISTIANTTLAAVETIYTVTQAVSNELQFIVYTALGVAAYLALQAFNIVFFLGLSHTLTSEQSEKAVELIAFAISFSTSIIILLNFVNVFALALAGIQDAIVFTYKITKTTVRTINRIYNTAKLYYSNYRSRKDAKTKKQ